MNFFNNTKTRALRSGLLVSLTIAASTAFSGVAWSQESTVWRFAHTTPIIGTVWHRYATEIVPQRIEEATNGAVQIEVITGVVQPADLLSSVREGTVQGGSLILPYVGATLPTWNIMTLPGLLQDESRYPELVNETLMPYVREDAERRFNAVPVMFFASTGASWFSNGPIDSVDKISGTKYRVHSPELSQLVQTAGGASVSIQFGEVPAAIQRRMIDAYTGALPSANAAKLYEVTRYAENWPAGLGGNIYVISSEALESLPEDVHALVVAEFEELNLEVQKASLDEAKAAAENLAAEGMKLIDVPQAEREELIRLAKENVWPLWLQNAGPEGEELLKSVQEALN